MYAYSLAPRCAFDWCPFLEFIELLFQPKTVDLGLINFFKHHSGPEVCTYDILFMDSDLFWFSQFFTMCFGHKVYWELNLSSNNGIYPIIQIYPYSQGKEAFVYSPFLPRTRILKKRLIQFLSIIKSKQTI